MINLFWKIFIVFWLAMIAMGGAIAWTTAQFGRDRIPLMIEQEKEQFADNVDRAEDALHTGGVAGMKRWLNNPAHGRGLNIFVIDQAGNEVLGRAIPPQLMRLIAVLRMQGFAGEAPFGAAPRGGYDEWSDRARKRDSDFGHEHRALVVRPVAVPGEGFYYLIAIFRPPHPVWRLFSIPALLLAIMISGAVCFAFARYLSSPVRRLRAATQALAAGNLGIRVGSLGGLGGRGDEIGGLSRDFDRMAERLQSLIESQKALLRDVSHELRSPLARLQAALGLARRHTDGRAAEELDRIEREAERLNELIGQILSLSRMAGETLERSRESVDLTALIDTVCHDADFEARQHDRRVAFVATAPVTVSGNPDLLHSAIENVVRNAVHYTAAGTTVEVTLAAAGAGVEIRVRDHGPGVLPEHLVRIFEPFFRASEARERGSGGYGLGLAIAQRAIELHGGLIGADNEPTGGLTVTLRLPLAPEQAGS